MLIVPLRVGESAQGLTTWQAHNVRWIDETRIVGPFDDSTEGRAGPKEEEACQDWRAFEAQYTFGLLQADSPADAWRAGLLLQDLIRSAEQSRTKLPFALRCEAAGDRTLCKIPRRVLAKLKLAALWDARSCDGTNSTKDCLRLKVGVPGHFGADYWQLTVKLSPENGEPQTVLMEFVVPPVL
jgi:hypothetical protein